MKRIIDIFLWKSVRRSYLLISSKGVRVSIRSFIDSDSRLHNYTSVHGGAVLENVTMDSFSYVTSTKMHNVNIGKFCSIASGSIIGGLANHPHNFISTSPVFYSNRGEVQFGFCNKNDLIDSSIKQVDIANDVWIGANVIIFPGVKVGNGAVIGAGSVVTKDVDPYTIVAGIPAKMIRKRFENQTILKLLHEQWWDWDVNFFIENPCIFATSGFDDVLDKYQKWRNSLK